LSDQGYRTGRVFYFPVSAYLCKKSFVKNKKWLLLLIIAFPSFFWLILETSTINSHRLPFYGPKTTKSEGDTVFHDVKKQLKEVNLAEEKNGFVLCFLGEEFRKDAYRLTGLWEYLNYKQEKIEQVPFILLTESERLGNELAELGKHKNVRLLNLTPEQFKELRKSCFLEKPYYIDVSFFVLLDKDAHVRGFYDARYVSEVKRLIGEYQHLRLKEEKKKLIETNEIEKKF
jgi:hypothetical protein